MPSKLKPKTAVLEGIRLTDIPRLDALVSEASQVARLRELFDGSAEQKSVFIGQNRMHVADGEMQKDLERAISGVFTRRINALEKELQSYGVDTTK